MPGDKHAPNRLASYIEIHNSVMAHLEARGFVVSNGLSIEPYGNRSMLISGEIECLGGISVTVHKVLTLLDGEGGNAIVQTTDYRYHAWLRGRGNILRYDSPHPHRPHHHVHRYDVLSNDRAGTIYEVPAREWPTLGEVLHEIEGWYYENYARLES